MKKYIISLLEKVELLRRHFVAPENFLKKMFKKRVGYELNLENPHTYNEKLQWLKLYDHNPLYTTLVDKYEVKQYVADKIGSQYIIKTLGVWDNVKDIDFDKLPNQFVLKCTHDSGGLVICKDKTLLDKRKACKVLNKSMKRNYYYMGFEWPYKDVKPRIIAEEYMEDSKTKELRDYKFFCFDGEVKALFIATDRQNRVEPYIDFFDAHFNHLPFERGHGNAPLPPQKPERFEQMKVLASNLASAIPHVRVDFYEVDGRILFGEMTFFPGAGMEKFIPKQWDEVFGEWIKLPAKRV